MSDQGFRLYERMKSLEDYAANLGFALGPPKHGFRNDGDRFGLYPYGEDGLPIYSRDAEIWCGDLESIQSFLKGWELHLEYILIIKVSTEKKIERKEQDWRNKVLMDKIKFAGKEDLPIACQECEYVEKNCENCEFDLTQDDPKPTRRRVKMAPKRWDRTARQEKLTALFKDEDGE